MKKPLMAYIEFHSVKMYVVGEAEYYQYVAQN